MPKNLIKFFLFFSFIGNGQTLSGVITDASTSEPLPYVHIGIKYTAKGTISKDDGTFSITLDGIDEDKSLFFSILGYEGFSIAIDEIKEPYLEVRLKPLPFSLSEVVVNSSKRKFKKIKLGNHKASTTTTGQSGNEEFGWGGEWGIILPKPTQEYKIKDINFHLRFNTVDSILFRVNVYGITNKTPKYKSMLQKSAFVTSRAGDHWITLDMTDSDLWIDDKILVTMEWVRIWYSDEGENHIFFTQAKNNKHRVVHRNNSFGTWQTDKRPPLAIYVNGLIEKNK